MEFEIFQGSVTFDGETYASGDTYQNEDQCRVWEFYKAYVAQNPTLSVGEQNSGIIDLLEFGCQGTGDVDVPENDHDDQVENPSTTGSDEPPGDGQETATSIAAPDPNQSAEATVDGLPDGLSPAEQYYYPTEPQADYDLADELTADGMSDTDMAQTVEQAALGEDVGQAHPFRSEDEEQQEIATGDPVDLFSGEFLIEKVDMEIPARGFPFRFVRSYQSGRPYYGPFGYNWDHSYNVYLRELNDGTIGIRTGYLHEDVFTPSLAGGFDPPRKVYAKLEATTGGGVTTGYSLTQRGGTKWVFERPGGWPDPARIPLVRIEDPNGNKQQLLYNSNGQLTRVIDTVGREISFAYNACNLLDAVTDFTGRTVRYEYETYTNHLVSVTTPTTFDYPDGLVTCYEYDVYQDYPALQHNITRVTDPKGQTVVENTYGTDPTNDNFNRVIEQYYLDEEWTYTYSRLRYVPSKDSYINDAYLRVEVQSCCTPYEVYTFNFRGNILDHRFRLCADGSYRLWAMTYRYNANGEMIEVRQPNGLGATLAYDDKNTDPAACGNLLRVALVAPPTSMLTDRVVAIFTYEEHYQNVKTVEDERGIVTTFVYDYEDNPAGPDAGNLVRVEYPDVILPDGSVQQGHEKFEYDDYGALTRYESAAGIVTEYESYDSGDSAGYLRQISRDPAGDPLKTSFEYDLLGNVALITNGLGFSTQMETDELGHVRRVVLPEIDGRSAEILLEYNEDGLLKRERIPRGTYSDDTLVGDWIINEHFYDVGGRLIKTSLAANTASPRIWAYERDAVGRIVALTDPLGRQSEFSFDERGLVLKAIAWANTSEALTWEYHYDRNGNQDSGIDPSGRRIEFDYDSWDRLTEYTWPADAEDAATTVSLTYGERDEVSEVRVKGLSGSSSATTTLRLETIETDERGRPYRRTIAGTVFETWFDSDGRVTARVDPRGNRFNLEYDGRGMLAQTTDALGNQRSYKYDAAGNLTKVVEADVDPASASPASRTYGFEHDPRGRFIRATDPLGNTLETKYDDRNLPISKTDPLGRSLDLEYDVSGATVKASIAVGGTRLEQVWSRDLLGRLIGFTDPSGRTTDYELTAHDQIRRIRFPDGSIHEKFYDEGGQLVGETSPSGTGVAYMYDTAGRIALVTFEVGPGVAPSDNLSVQYDGLDRPTRITSGTQLLERSYDSFDRIIREWYGGREVHTIYDDLNGLVDFVFPDGRRDRTALDALGRIDSIQFRTKGAAGLLGSAIPTGTALASYTYFGPYSIRSRRLANGTQTEYGYDGAARLTSITHRDSSGATAASTQYLHDANGLRRLAFSTPAPGTQVLFEYDELSRLVWAYEGVSTSRPPNPTNQAEADSFLAGIDPATASAVRNYSLDGADNRFAWTIQDAGVTTAFSASHNALHQLTGLTESGPSGTSTAALAYDGNGNLSDDNQLSYKYDALDQLIEVRRNSDGRLVVAFHYDPLGRVISREWDSGMNEVLSHAGMRAVQREDGKTGTVVEQNTHGVGPDDLVLQSQSSGNLWMHLDGLLSLLALTDDTGGVLQRFCYSPFGEPNVWEADGISGVDTAAARTPPVFGGRPFLPNFGRYDFRARIYDSALGRFLQRDPSGYRDSACLYVYALHDPPNNLDPTGLSVGSPDRSFWNRGGITLALSGIGLLVGAGIVLSNPVGWVAAAGSLALAGGLAGTGMGTVELLASYTGQTTITQEAELNRAVSTTISFTGSPGGILGGTFGTLVTGDEEGLEEGAFYGGFAEAGVTFLYGSGQMAFREFQFGRLRVGKSGGDSLFTIARSFTHGAVRKNVQKILGYGEAASRIRASSLLPRGIERIELSHCFPDRLLKKWGLQTFGNRPLNYRAMWASEHALVDPERSVGIPNQQKLQYLEKWVRRAPFWMIASGAGILKGVSLLLGRELEPTPTDQNKK